MMRGCAHFQLFHLSRAARRELFTLASFDFDRPTSVGV
jgi:hypothetical protein